jgi:hypothetical protein
MGSELLHQVYDVRQVYDFGRSEEEVEALRARKAPTESELASMIVGETELKRHGRWGGRAAPRRWIPR